MKIPKGLGSMADLLARFEVAAENRELWLSLHQEALDYSSPSRETFTHKSVGQKRNRHIFDSTAITGLQQFSNRIQGALMPAWQEWIRLVAGDDIPDEDKDDVAEGLEKITKTVFSHLNHSNFYTEISPTTIDLGIGTGAILLEEGEFGKDVALKFSNVPLGELYPEKPASGSIDNVWRKQSIRPINIKNSWPEAVLTPDLEKMAEKASSSEVEILNGMLLNQESQLYEQVLIYPKKKHLLFTQSFKTKRLIVSRWHVAPGEVYGRGPVVQSLPDIRTANKVKQFILENAAMQMAGIFTGVNDGVFNPHTVRLSPGAIIPVSSNSSQNPSLRGLERSGDLGLGQLVLQDLQDNIRKSLFVDPIGTLSDPIRSATEIMLRNQDMLKNSGASFGRQKTELIEPIINGVLDILSSRGLIPELTANGRDVTLKQQSPLAKAESIDDFQNSQLWFQMVSQLPQEIVGASVRVEDLPRFWAESLGVPAALVRSEEEVQQISAAVQKQAQQGIEGGQIEG